jgi:hypothetical protein
MPDFVKDQVETFIRRRFGQTLWERGFQRGLSPRSLTFPCFPVCSTLITHDT